MSRTLEFGGRDVSAAALTVAAFALAVAVADPLVGLVVDLDVVSGPRFLGGSLATPAVTKLLPAVGAVAAWTRLGGDPARLRDRRFRLAALGGLTFGVVERAGFVLLKDATLVPVLLLPAFVHVATGLLVGAAVFGAAGRVDARRLALVVALLAAVALRVAWDGGGRLFVSQFVRSL